MAGRTDPAAELAKLLDSLSGNQEVSGSAFLAECFGVEEWSFEFYQILFSIIQRITDLQNLYDNLEGFEHLRAEMEGHLAAIKGGLNANGMQNAWKQWGAKHINPANIQPLKISSAFVRAHISYPDLSDEERDAVLKTVNELIEWLAEHQIEDNDFIRQAIIDGLNAFVFRLSRLKWLGWGYSLESLQSVITAYFALERGFVDEATTPQTGAALKKLSSGLRSIFDKVGVAKDIVDRTDFILKSYGAIMLASQAGKGIIGLISGSAS